MWSWVHPPTDPARPGDSQITYLGGRACELSKGCQNHKMTGSLPRGMLLDDDLSSCGHHGSYSSQKFTELHDSNWDETGHANLQTLVWSDPVSHEVWDMHYPMSASWKSSPRTKTMVEGVSMLQSQTMIHVIMIPNHEVMIYFWGETRGQLKLCNYYSQLC